MNPPTALSGAESLLDASRNAHEPLDIVVQGEGTFLIDWGVERAAWFEFVSPDLESADFQHVTACLSEYNEKKSEKIKPLTKYGTTYRLETNDELYEGVRFTWINFPTPSKPWRITSVSLVAKVKPVNYTGSFSSSDDTLTKSWYTGAYGVRLNMESDGFNSVLVERGDRVSIQGDGHPTMAASHVAFSTYKLVQEMLIQTNSGFVHGHHVVDDTIMPYPIYWTMSVNDWFLASGDVEGFLDLAPDAMSIIDKRVNDFLKDPNLVWMGWDDRLGDGWCTPGSLAEGGCGREAHLTFAALIVRACSDLGRSLNLAGMAKEGKHYHATAKRLGTLFREVPEWPNGLGVHSAANVMNAASLIATAPEIDSIFEQYLTDSVTVCSFSNFNQYWILQGMGNANKIEHALASIKLCWGTALDLGTGCFWENYSPDWASWMNDGDKGPIGISYCHPWSSGVTAWLSHVVGGVQPLLPGYKHFLVAPFLSLNYPHVDVVVTTPVGAIAVTADLNSTASSEDKPGEWSTKLKLKATTPGFVALRTPPSEECSLKLLSTTLNRTEATALSLSDISASSGMFEPQIKEALLNSFSARVASNIVFIEIPSGGVHTISALYSGACQSHDSSTADKIAPITRETSFPGIPHFPPFPVPEYPALTYLDRETSGDGIEEYGSDGYVLFGFQNGTDLRNLPAYIKNVTVHHHGYGGWSKVKRTYVGKSPSNNVYIKDPRPSHKGERALGFMGSDSSTQFGRGVIVDVEIDDNFSGSFQLAVYCVAQSPGDKHAIRVEDIKSMNVVAPTRLVANYTGGVWWSVKYNRSFRLRLMRINNAHASALAFGPSGLLGSSEATTVSFE